jgi:DNA-directed RNA polymerase subunit RPC12/RpoP
MAARIAIMPVVLACPSCPACGTRMLLVSVSPDKPDHDRRIYECPRCLHEVTEVIQFRKAG